MSSTATPTVSNYSSIVPINPNMDQFSNIEKLNLNDLTEEYIDIYVPLEVIEGNSIKNINLNYDLSEPSANDLIILNADEYIKNIAICEMNKIRDKREKLLRDKFVSLNII